MGASHRPLLEDIRTALGPLAGARTRVTKNVGADSSAGRQKAFAGKSIVRIKRIREQQWRVRGLQQVAKTC